MTMYLALLRGVNLGPHRRVAMADLRSALSDSGFGDVRTHLQSGNVVLRSDEAADAVGAAVQRAIEARLGLRTAVIVRTREQWDVAIAADPLGDVATDPARHVIGFLSATPDPSAVAAVEARIAALLADGDRHAFVNDHFYLWCPNGISRSPYFKTPWNRLGVEVTQRNYNTVLALRALAGDAAPPPLR